MVKVRVLIMGPLKEKTGVDGALTEEGNTVREVVEKLLAHENIRKVFINKETQQLQPYLRFFLRGNEASLDTPVADGDELLIVPPVLGG